MSATDPPYAGLKVLDLSQGLAGPSCATMLLQNGAEVVKVEPPEGDWSRGIGFGADGFTGLSLAGNLGKKSLCLDARTERGRALLQDLAARADVLIESFRPGVLGRLGLDFAGPRTPPGAVWLSVSGFGGSGPYAGRPGTDSTIQAMSGLMSVNAGEDGVPRKVGCLVVDAAAGIAAAQAVGVALYRRATTGRGSHVHISLLEVALALQAHALLDHGIAAGRPRQPVAVPAGTFATRDGFVNVTALHDRMFRNLATVLGREDWLSRPGYATADERFARRGEIESAVAAALAERPSEDWLRRLEAADVLCGEVLDYDALPSDPQIVDQGLLHSVMQPPFGAIAVPRHPGTALGPLPAPRLGEHTREILVGLGLRSDEIDALQDAGVVREP